jgi:hypothetical protein
MAKGREQGLNVINLRSNLSTLLMVLINKFLA